MPELRDNMQIIRDLGPALVSPLSIYMKGIDNLSVEGDKKEQDKKYMLRGGTAGCYLPDKNGFIGANPREALGRFLGLQVKKPKRVKLIFQSGLGSEKQFEVNVRAAGVQFKSDTDYPIYVENWAGKYPLSGRPDGVFLKNDVPQFGVELKAVLSSSSAEKIFLEDKPKTENLCQATKYTLATGLPWVLIYSNIAAQGKFKTQVPIGHKEFFISLEDDKVVLESDMNPRRETVITASGVHAFDQAIVEAYETKDISFLDWLDGDIFGQPNPYDGRVYSEWDLAVSANQSYDNWLRDAELISKSKYIITYKGGKTPEYVLVNVEEEEQFKRGFQSLQAARRELFVLNGRK